MTVDEFKIIQDNLKEIEQIVSSHSMFKLNLHIHQIEDEDGILFSDGEYTNGLSHCADCIKKWMEELKKDIKSPKFNFVNK